MNFNNFTLFQEAEENIIIRGPGINSLKHAFADMFSRGAPKEKNDFGFNGQHYDPAEQLIASPEFNGDGLSIRTARYILSVLNVYKNTQLPQYKDIKAEVEAEIEKQAPHKAGPKATASGQESVVVYRNVKSYNKIKVHVSETDNNHTKGQINSIVSRELEKENAQTITNDWGKQDYHWKDKLKYLARDREDPRIIWVNPKILEDVLNIYRKKGYDVTYEGQETPEEDPSTKAGEKQAGPQQPKKGKVVINKIEKRRIFFSIKDLSYDEWNPIRLDLVAKGVWGKAIKYNGKLSNGVVEYILDGGDQGIRDVLAVLFNSNKIDMEDLIHAIGDIIPQTEHTDKDDIDFDNIKHTADIKIKLIRRVSDLEFQQIREIIVYTFPERAQYDSQSRSWIIGGDYQQYILFGRLLKDHNFDVEHLRGIIRQKCNDGDLNKESVQGDVPDALWSVVEKHSKKAIKSFKDKKSAQEFLDTLPEKEHYEIEYLPHFQEMIDEMLPNKRPDITLHKAQKEGIEFLFHRKTAILGDETGLGKTIQLIGAAEMKMQEYGYHHPTLILAINDVTAKQWAQEIIKIIGPDADISLDCANPKRWTVLTYNLFSHKRKGMETMVNTSSDGSESEETGCIHALQKAKFGIVIFDELHKIKSDKTKRWQRLTQISDSIPVRWGATATISANDAMDVKNQLLIIGHHLGKLPDGKFKKDFAGMKLVDTPVGKRYARGDEEDRLAAAERLNKWLHLTGVYMRRKKSDVREMPNLEVGQKEVPINVESYTKKVMQRLQSYEERARQKGKPTTEAEHLKEMIAQRTELATAKVPETIRITEDLVKHGKRVIVFTAFKESAEELAKAFQAALPKMNPEYKLLTYISSTKKEDRKYVKDRFNNEEKYRVLLMSLKMGSTGIDFPNAASEMVINDYDWTPEQAEQSEGRIYRINTNQDVSIHYVIARGTYDETLYKLVQLKRRIAQKIQETREEYRKEKNTGKSNDFLKQIVALQKQIIGADAEIKKVEAEELAKVLPKGSFKEYYINRILD